jgi:hypothetical protein
MTRAPVRAAGLVVTVAAGVAASVATGRAFNPQPEPPAFGMIGLARTQTAILNAVLTEAGGGTRTGCHVVLSFVDAAGEPLHEAAGNPVSQKVTLHGGAAQSLHLPAVQALPAGQVRVPIRAVIGAGPEPAAADCGGLVTTLEIVNARGRTTVFYPGRRSRPPWISRSTGRRRR